MSLGLGANYDGNFKLQIAFPRVHSGNPYLCWRTRESNVWNSWIRIAAGYADSAGVINGNGKCNFHGGSPVAVPSNFMDVRSLTIGHTARNYGWGWSWNDNTSGLIMKCVDNTEIAVHDAGHRVTSLIGYQGGGSYNHIHIGRDMGWGTNWAVVIQGGNLQITPEWSIYKGTPPHGTTYS